MNLMDSLERAMGEFSRDERYAFVDRSGKVTFDQMKEQVKTALTWLRKNHCKRGDRIASLTRNCTQSVALEWATYRLGGVWMPIPARERKPDNIISMLHGCKPSIFLLEPGALLPLDLSTLLSSPDFRFKKVGRLGGFQCFEPRRRSRPVRLKIGRKLVTRIRFTSGVSGQPKGIAYTKGTQDAVFENIREWVVNKPEIMIHGAPIVWASGSLIAPVFSRGGCNVLLPKWSADKFAAKVREEECTLTFLTPKMLSHVLTYSERNGTLWAMSLRRVLLAGAPTPVSTMRRALDLFNDTEFYTTLGMTEASFPITWHRVERADVDPAKNRPYVPLGTLTDYYRKSDIVAASNRSNSGELMVVGNAVAAGTWRWCDARGKPLPRPHAEALEKPFPSGDMVERETSDKPGEDAVYHYLCRKDRTCMKRGIWDSPDAIEAVLSGCDGVERVRVDRMTSYQRRLRVNLTVQRESSKATRETVRQHFESRKAQANLPHVIIRRINFGRVELTSSGKTVRKPRLCD